MVAILTEAYSLKNYDNSRFSRIWKFLHLCLGYFITEAVDDLCIGPPTNRGIWASQYASVSNYPRQYRFIGLKKPKSFHTAAAHILHFFFFDRCTPGPLFHCVPALRIACIATAPSRRFPAPPHLLLLRPTIIAVPGRSFRLHRCSVQSACTAAAPHRRGGCSDAATASIAFV